MFGAFNGRLSVGFRLALIAFLFVATVGLSAGLHIRRGLEQLDSTKIERQGQGYIDAVWQSLTAGQAAGLDAYADLNRRFATETQAKAFAEAASPTKRKKAAEKLIWDVSAASNLAQDPGADSFYVAEALTKRLPALASEVEAVSNAVAMASSDPQRNAKITAALAKLETDVGKAAVSYQTAIHNDRSGQTAAALRGPSKALMAAVKALSRSAEAAAATGGAGDYDDAASAFSSALAASWNATDAELERLLEQRLENGQNTLIFDLCMIAALAIPALLLIWLVTAGLSRRFRDLDEAMARLNRGDKSVIVPYLDDTNETGRIAQTLAVMKQSLIQREKDERQREVDRLAAEEARKQAEADAQAKSEALVVGTFGEGLKALAQEKLSYRLTGELPPAYRKLKDDFNTAIAQFEESRRKSEEAVRQREADRIAAAEARKRVEEEAHARSVEVVVTSFGEGLAALARRDLTYRLNRELPVEYRILQDDFNNAISQLEDTLTDVFNRVEDISGNAQEIRKAAHEMAQRTERQAAALEESAAAINEVTATVGKSSDNAKEANAMADSAQTDAEHGSDVAKQSIDAMRLIAKSSNEITSIIGVMDEIAFQTNLLALNAGVEAARAGEAGKGFAVVASEVRLLAQRSGEAAKKIRRLISSSEEQVTSGVKLVEENGQALQRIADDIGQISALMNEIAAAQTEQATTLREIDTAVTQMDQSTQQNAAMAEQSHAASEALANYAAELRELVGRFATEATLAQAQKQAAE